MSVKPPKIINSTKLLNMQTDSKKNPTTTDANNVLVAVLIRENRTVVRVNRECELCGGVVDKYDKFTEEEHCQNCGWS